MVVNELRGEKIDIVPFSDDLADFVSKALSPAKVNQVMISDDGTQADVIVPDHQLSLAIGREGQNARLAARLTGVRIDIRSESQLADGVPAGAYLTAGEPGVEYAEGEWVTNPDTGEMEWHAADGTVVSQSEWAESSGVELADDDANAESDSTTDAADSENATDSDIADDGEAAPSEDAAAGGGDDEQ